MGARQMKQLIFFIMLIILSLSVNGLDCEESYYEIDLINDLYFDCEDVSSDVCYSYVYLDNPVGGLISAYPQAEFSSFGVVEGFIPVDNRVLINIPVDDLRPNYNYTFAIVCGNETVEFNNYVNAESLEGIARAGVYIKDNLMMIFFILLAIVIIILIIFFVAKKVMRGVGL